MRLALAKTPSTWGSKCLLSIFIFPKSGLGLSGREHSPFDHFSLYIANILLWCIQWYPLLCLQKITTQNKPLHSKGGPSWCKGPRKSIQACQGRGQGALLLREWLRHSEALSSWESGRTVPFPPQDLCSPCVCVLEYWNLSSRSCGPRSASLSHSLNRRAPRPLLWQAFIGFLGPLHQRWFSFTTQRLVLGGYLLQTKERVSLNTSKEDICNVKREMVQTAMFHNWKV